ncbi:MAG: twin-arginine translocase TatA/TatE family subunit [Candidatus Hydrogenedentes bacterium]|nr:twin-arginine translocase TatA/TatE family subunit [Candidatus Hydrogenedentota bacterium]
MFGSIGITELLLIAAIALMFLGPEKFPEFAKIMARTIRDIRGYVQDAQKDIAKELKPIKKELDDLSKIDPEAYLDKLAESGEDEDESPPNVEPDTSSLSFDLDTEEEGESIDGTIQYDSYDSAPEEPKPADEDSDDPEKLDG